MKVNDLRKLAPGSYIAFKHPESGRLMKGVTVSKVARQPGSPFDVYVKGKGNMRIGYMNFVDVLKQSPLA